MVFIISNVNAKTPEDSEFNLAEQFTDSVVVLEETDFFPMPRGAFLKLGNLTLGDNGDGTLAVGGFTHAHQVSEQLELNIILQQSKDGEGWMDVCSWDATRYNDTLLMKGFTVLVPLKHYYRLRAIHLVSDGDVLEYISNITAGIMIDIY